MDSLFDTGNDALVSRIERLAPSSAALWGKMNVAQMLAHCSIPIRLATAEVRGQRTWIGLLLGWLVRGRVLGPSPFPKNGPTDPKFIVQNERDFAREQGELIAQVRRVRELGLHGLTKDPHPFFGKLSASDWDTLLSKHLDHHLRQFGV